ncbi:MULTISPECIES: cupin domain-containing protein [unclassified Cyanobium]|uniref:cupin domain-containing protein n=1 Tax=unclassified Cyanobium TaxID=2627006 RepID=UPI0020CCA8EC|nr:MULTISPECIES: cupin domain-containing protein [unclassified Cyanobium]MCP9858887.1 cupin domain-containing protein [Cyanobium sp. Cruz-8H5]MCP9866123.1 cupin domain-containing protein [Cyanobium sp. Cruz-8D1]
MASRPEALIARFALQPHPEGGWYRELHRSASQVCRSDDGKQRAGLTVIAFLLTEGQCSRWHRVEGGDEVWHHAGGDPLDLWRLPPQGGAAERLLLAPLAVEATGDPEPSPLQVVPAGWWQAARSRGRWSLLHCCVGPGFAFEDFRLMADLPPAERPAGADPAWL